jgi:hypothetical protein
MRFLLISLFFFLCATIEAAEDSPHSIRILVQSSPLAGFQYYGGNAHWAEMQVGDELTLTRETDNRYDKNAVRVEWQGIKLGYLPRAENRTVAAEMDREQAQSSPNSPAHTSHIVARIARRQESSDPWQRLLIEVFLKL